MNDIWRYRVIIEMERREYKDVLNIIDSEHLANQFLPKVSHLHAMEPQCTEKCAVQLMGSYQYVYTRGFLFSRFLCS